MHGTPVYGVSRASGRRFRRRGKWNLEYRMQRYVHVPTYGWRLTFSGAESAARQSTAPRVSQVSPVQLRRRCRNPVTILPAQLLLYRGACLGDLTVPGRIVPSSYPTDPLGQLRREFHALRALLARSPDKPCVHWRPKISASLFPTACNWTATILTVMHMHAFRCRPSRRV